MNKQILSFVSLSVLALAHPVARVAAAPPDPASSTEASDRKFLAKLENADAPTAAAPAEPAPIPATQTVNPSPAEKPAQSEKPARAEKPVQAKVVVKKPVEVAKMKSRERVSVPAEAVNTEPVPAGPTTVTTVTTGTQPAERSEHHGFFHRLFNHARAQQHPEDW